MSGMSLERAVRPDRGFLGEALWEAGAALVEAGTPCEPRLRLGSALPDSHHLPIPTTGELAEVPVYKL